MDMEEDPNMMGEMGSGAAKEMDKKGDPGAMPQEEQGGVIHIPKDMLPAGMSEKVNKGDILEFRAIGPADSDGDIPVEYNTGKEEKGESWEDGFRKEMSPRNRGNDTGETMSDGAQQGY